MMGFDIDWESLLSNTREDANQRRDICRACENWDGAQCQKWDVPTGSREPWLGLQGSCPVGRWYVGRIKTSPRSNITRTAE